MTIQELLIAILVGLVLIATVIRVKIQRRGGATHGGTRLPRSLIYLAGLAAAAVGFAIAIFTLRAR